MAKGYNGGYFIPIANTKSEHNAKASAKVITDEFKDHIITEGALEWQWKYC